MSLARFLAQASWVARRDSDAISDAYAWPPRAPLTDEERRECERLSVLRRAFGTRRWRWA
jgi:hypothetical protein